MHNIPYWRLSGFYFFYFAFVGVMSPYWGLYLKSLQFSALQIGVLMSLLAVMRIFAPNVWGWMADRTGRRVQIVQVAAVASLVAYSGVFFGSGFFWLFAVMALMSFFWSASLPLVEATTLSHLGERTSSYGRIRLWGSVGFIFAVVGVGYVLDWVPISSLPWIVLGFLCGIALFSQHIPEAPLMRAEASQQTVWRVLRKPEVMALIAACFLMSAAHGPYYTFYSIYLVEHAYSKSSVGWLWAVGVICEIGVFIWMPHLLRRFSLRRILLFSFAMAVLRFLLIAWGVEWFALVLFAQTLHAFSFGAYHAAAVALIHHYFRGKNQARGQAIYASLSFGAGGALGSLYSGYTWEALGPQMTFSIAAGLAFVAMLVLMLKLKPVAENEVHPHQM
jgi:PPP family 3-phenylpropionic acid transporter